MSADGNTSAVALGHLFQCPTGTPEAAPQWLRTEYQLAASSRNLAIVVRVFQFRVVTVTGTPKILPNVSR
jgi:hypothetical protein